MDGGRRLEDVVRQFDRQSEVLPRVPWFTDAERARGLLDFARVTAGERVLEVGCGPGVVLEQAVPRAARVAGVDVSPDMLRGARARAHGAELARGVGERLPFRDGAFDVTLSRSVLHHAMDPASMLREQARIVRPGGRVVVNDSIASENPEWARNHNHAERLRDPSHGRMLPGYEFLGLARAAGLRVLDVRRKVYPRDFEEWMDITSPPEAARQEVLRLFRGWADRDESGLRVRLRDGRLLFDIVQWFLLAEKP